MTSAIVPDGDRVGADARISYLTMNSILDGVGASQVLPYLKLVSEDGYRVRLMSFESGTPARPQGIARAVDWHPASSSAPAIQRLRASHQFARQSRSTVLHARSDLPALSAIAARHPRWIWDMRALWRDQRMVLGSLRRGSVAERSMRTVEHQASARASAIVVLADAVIPVLRARHGPQAAKKAVVIPTAVDTERFVPSPTTSGGAIDVLLSGSLNGFYDGEVMVRFLHALKGLRPVKSRWVGASEHSPWYGVLVRELDSVRGSAPFEKMPSIVATSDLGLIVCRDDAGPALTAAMPTKVAEFLSCGRPIVVSKGLGDLDDLIDRYRCGVVIEGRSDAAMHAATNELVDLLSDRDLSARCRACAMEHFDLRSNVRRLEGVYRGLM